MSFSLLFLDCLGLTKAFMLIRRGTNKPLLATRFLRIVKSMPALGKLGMKHEPAGKIRVFAMVDPWTQ